MTQSATDTKTGNTNAPVGMRMYTVWITAGTTVQISGVPVTLTQDTPVQASQENVTAINRDLLVPHGQSER